MPVWLSALTRRPGRTMVGAAATALVTGIVLNATMFQTGPHPAPLFGGAPLAVTNVRTVSVPPMPAARPVDMSSLVQSVTNAPVAPQPAPQAAPQAVPRASARELEALIAQPAPQPKKDAIASLLKGADPSQEAAPSARVAAVQKALMKSGFVVRPDGVMGLTTKQAIERFERDHRLPVTADLTPRTLRELSALSGVTIP